ncbi:hypothetical protein [Streptomyces sp. NPDC001933]|uniref:hypothetical protein n=1 Tax=Streptomyces sp. NPDC001933 TaxID=3364626 RepID=UPI00368EB093
MSFGSSRRPDEDGEVDRDDPVQADFGVGPGRQGVKTWSQAPSTARFRSRS